MRTTRQKLERVNPKTPIGRTKGVEKMSKLTRFGLGQILVGAMVFAQTSGVAGDDAGGKTDITEQPKQVQLPKDWASVSLNSTAVADSKAPSNSGAKWVPSPNWKKGKGSVDARPVGHRKPVLPPDLSKFEPEQLLKQGGQFVPLIPQGRGLRIEEVPGNPFPAPPIVINPFFDGEAREDSLPPVPGQRPKAPTLVPASTKQSDKAHGSSATETVNVDSASEPSTAKSKAVASGSKEPASPNDAAAKVSNKSDATEVKAGEKDSSRPANSKDGAAPEAKAKKAEVANEQSAVKSKAKGNASAQDEGNNAAAEESQVTEEQSSMAAHPASSRPKYYSSDFSPTPVDGPAMQFSAAREAWVYDAKQEVPTQHPLVEWPRVWYGNGITPKGFNLFGMKNLVRPKFYMYGDYRAGIQGGRNAAGRADNFANRLNLDLDLQITDTERFHTFINPLDENGQFTRIELIDGDLKYRQEIDFTPATAFFEGDLGVFMGTARGKSSPFELPFTAGLVPLLFQNGIWMEDAVTGFAFALPAKHSRLFNIANMDLTFFAVFDELNSPAFASEADAQAFGTAWFLEMWEGYVEAGYAFLNDRNNDARDYHNLTFSFSKRYFHRISNSVRVIFNTGQDGDKNSRTADGGILLLENSWITAKPLTVVPYANFFYGWDRPQSVARAGGSGGILRNTGLNFQTDGLNGFAFLDDTGIDTAGGAIGVDLIGDQLDRQLIIEAAYQHPHGNKNPNVPDDQFAVGGRAQYNLTNWTLIRVDAMHGWRRGLEDIYGTRVEWRWKF